MPNVVALYRYPVKGLTPESCQTLKVLAENRIAGDRVLGFRFADTPEADDAWSSKHGMLVLVNTPGLARLEVRFDDAVRRLQLRLDGETLADETLDDVGRKRLSSAIAAYAATLRDSGIEDHPERLPLRLIGDGVTPRYHDSSSGGVSLHGRSSLRALGDALAHPEVSEARFRSNIAIEGIEPWEEQDWVGTDAAHRFRELSGGAADGTLPRHPRQPGQRRA